MSDTTIYGNHLPPDAPDALRALPLVRDETILYTVTMLESAAALPRGGPIAICTSQERACRIVELNDWDIHETDHALAVVAAICADEPYGLLAGEEVPEIWYRWDGDADDGEYVRCAKPDRLASVHFGL